MANRRAAVPINYMAVAVDTLGGPGAAADAIGVSRQVIYKWLKAAEEGRLGDIGYKYVLAIAKASGLPPSKLTGISDFKRPEQD